MKKERDSRTKEPKNCLHCKYFHPEIFYLACIYGGELRRIEGNPYTRPDWCEFKVPESSVKQEDVSRIMNAINDALESMGYEAVGYENTDAYLNVLIDRIT